MKLDPDSPFFVPPRPVKVTKRAEKLASLTRGQREYARSEAAGTCVRCGRDRDRDGKKVCAACAEKQHREHLLKVRRKLIEEIAKKRAKTSPLPRGES